MKIKFLIFFMSLFFLTSIELAYAQQNPFLRKQPSVEKTEQPQVQELDQTQPDPAPISDPNLWTDLKSQFQTLQYNFNRELAQKTRQAKEEQRWDIWLVLMLIAFAYGAFHTLGPGHGKCVVCSYFISEESSLKKGLMLGYMVAIIHALSAFTVVFLIYYIVQGSTQLMFDQATQITSLIGYGLITVLGSYLLIKNFTQQPIPKAQLVASSTDSQACGHDHHHDDHHHGQSCDHHHHHENKDDGKPVNIFLVAAGIGLVPCPGALTILLFSISLNFLLMGVVLAFMIALGMGVTISLLAILTILSRKGMLTWLTPQSSATSFQFDRLLRVSGASFTMLFGFIFFLASI